MLGLNPYWANKYLVGGKFVCYVMVGACSIDVNCVLVETVHESIGSDNDLFGELVDDVLVTEVVFFLSPLRVIDCREIWRGDWLLAPVSRRLVQSVIGCFFDVSWLSVVSMNVELY